MSAPLCSCDTYGKSGMKNTCSQAAQQQAKIADLERQLAERESQLVNAQAGADDWKKRYEGMAIMHANKVRMIESGELVYSVSLPKLDEQLAEANAKLAALEQQKPVYLFRRRGRDDFCTCSKERYEESAQEPKFFEVKKLYAKPILADSDKEDAERWQPIETAPKDGSSVLVMWAKSITIARVAGKARDGGYYWRGIDNLMAVSSENARPTHWMPLPSAPTDAARKEVKP